jgi:hypothetical protein
MKEEEKKEKKTKQSRGSMILWGVLFFILLSPLLFSGVKSWKGPALFNVVETDLSLDALTLRNVLEGHFQRLVEKKCKEKIAFSNYWIRAYNELLFRVFQKSKTYKLVLGKNNYFYEEIYITEYLGRNFIGDSLMQKKVQYLSFLQKLLLDQYQIYLIPVIEPGKASYNPDHIPDHYRPHIKGKNNYESFVEHATREQVLYLDLNRYFKELRPTVPHPLYSHFGIHWSSYGMWVAADTLTHYLEATCNIKLPELYFRGDSVSTTDKDLDFDLEPPMNLLFPLPTQPIYFPIVEIIADSHSVKPKVLTVGDSYYWSMINNGYVDQVFSENPYWYYYHTIWSDIWNWNVTVDTSQLKNNILHHQIILLTITDANLYRFGWGFIEDAIEKLAPDYPIDPEILFLNRFLAVEEQYNLSVKEAIRQQKTFEEIIRTKYKEKE